ncbi:MAG: hypothetical protein PVF80_14020, partial [Gammaproteobacteria bacterium]
MPATRARSRGLAEGIGYSNSRLRKNDSENWSFFDLTRAVPGLEKSLKIVGLAKKSARIRFV